MKKKEYIGRFVRLRRRIQTQGGVVIPEGSIMKISATWRGKFTVEALDSTPNDMGGASAQACKGVSDYEFDLLPKNPREQARLALVAAAKVAGRYGLGYQLGPFRLTEVSLSSVSVIEIPPEDRPKDAVTQNKGMPW